MHDHTTILSDLIGYLIGSAPCANLVKTRRSPLRTRNRIAAGDECTGEQAQPYQGLMYKISFFSSFVLGLYRESVR